MGNLPAADAKGSLASTVDPPTSLSSVVFAICVVVCCVEAFLAIGHGRFLGDGLRSTLPWGTCLLPMRQLTWHVLWTRLRPYLALSFQGGRLLVGWKPFLEFDMVGFLVTASGRHCHGELANRQSRCCCRRGNFPGEYCGPTYVAIWLRLRNVCGSLLCGSFSCHWKW
jgi:hypothetical protein